MADARRQYDQEQAVRSLRSAVADCRRRGLKDGAKFASDLLLGIPQAVRDQMPPTAACEDTPERTSADDLDRFEAAKTYFDNAEYLRAHHVLVNPAPEAKLSQFLKHYALYLAGEKVKDETGIEHQNGSAASISLATSTNENPYLSQIQSSLNELYESQHLDSFQLYLLAVVTKQSRIEPSSSSVGDTTAGLPAPKVAAKKLLVESVMKNPYNWSAWTELFSLNLPTEEEELVLNESCGWMLKLYQAHRLVECQELEQAKVLLDYLSTLFPDSSYIASQHALVSYNSREFEVAQRQFAAIREKDPYRLEQADAYSNVLYVRGESQSLSKLAHQMLRVEKYSPETCCVIGNYYSLKGKRDKALLYFHRSLKLDPYFLPAWTLMGHEYVELKNTSAAVDAYRHAVDLNDRDHRAWHGLGQVYEILNMHLYAMYYYRKAANLRPKDARMWCALGSCLDKLGKSEEAISYFKQAIECGDPEGIAYHAVATVLAKKGERHEAAKYYLLQLGLEEGGAVDVVAERPQQLAAMLFLGKYYSNEGKEEQAIAFCTKLQEFPGREQEEANAELRKLRANGKARRKLAF